MPYLLTGEARHDIYEIRDYTHQQWGKQQSLSYLAHLRTTLVRLADMPDIGQNRSDEFGPNVYSFPCASHMIYYSKQPPDSHNNTSRWRGWHDVI
ncbi:type II toxin-antitoxin system RelE/ParE family toxin [Shimwellia blattae]|uniref:Uncharacterized protein n=1 Tax=Shimwellia blattae (strain ATCC 29907 / DSM 4481 / JCM 1650 / NBRC 105725 / CDC 9005-74) TaxID=630626 RepID=I2B5E5_SHIBC|nr:type II toxin-antitoxin system RelE/ParE family toxin [Shimwellia blattae]AFJ45749.1 hypothetical protein EBL_c06240 [Shimwellia blattae DSM 4481 = NBRC 105725]GAB82197.1 hypothetical protein EB105725_20_00920 [Shimwellia blattae DSM 4481 = NBRC 105725]VDY63233.1 Toxin ParE1 [Shimwellia blattae]VEC20929.1 Toxin ParE1 [Shimwellia blattae]